MPHSSANVQSRGSELLVEPPERILIELTNHCNLECITCARNDSHGHSMTKGVMRLETFKAIIDEVGGYVKELVLIGLGELLLYRPLTEAVDYISARSPHIRLFLATNGTVPTSARILANICEMAPTSIMFSVDGVGEAFERVRKGASFSEFKEIVASVIASAAAQKFSFNMVVCEQNYKDMTAVLYLAQELGINDVHFNSLNLAALPSKPLSAYDLYLLPAFCDELERATDVAKKLGIALTTFDFRGPRGFRTCTYPWTDYYITWEGLLALCCAQPFPKLQHFGNVLQAGVMPSVNSMGFQEVRKMWHRNESPWMCLRCHKVRQPASHQ